MTKANFTEGRGYTKADWEAVSDDQDTTPEDMSKAATFDKAFPALAASARRTRGPQKAPTKTLVSLRISPDVLERYRATGPGWQSRIDETLRKAVGL